LWCFCAFLKKRGGQKHQKDFYKTSQKSFTKQKSMSKAFYKTIKEEFPLPPVKNLKNNEQLGTSFFFSFRGSRGG
jgi:hypothetical protein